MAYLCEADGVDLLALALEVLVFFSAGSESESVTASLLCLEGEQHALDGWLFSFLLDLDEDMIVHGMLQKD